MLCLILATALSTGPADSHAIDRPCGLIEARLPSPESTRTDFGRAVAFDGSTAFVGAPLDREAGIQAGAVHVFERAGDGWNAITKLGPGIVDAGDSFGGALALTEGFLAVGSSGDENPDGVRRGSVTIFRHQGERWMREVVLFPPEGDEKSRFGWSLAASDNHLVIGAPGDRYEQDGRAFVYVRGTDGWRLQQQLRPLQVPYLLDFGFSVAIDGDWILVGAPLSDLVTFCQFQSPTGWMPSQEFNPGSRTTGAFGYALAVQGTTAIVGQPVFPSVHSTGGAAHVYERAGPDAWLFAETLAPEYRTQASFFGGSLAIDHDRLLVGTAPVLGLAFPNGLIQFRRSAGSWGTGVRILPPGLPGTTAFSTAFTIADEHVLAGTSQFSNDPESVWMLALGQQEVAPVRTRNAGTNVLALLAEPASVGAELNFDVELPPGYSGAYIFAFDRAAEVLLGGGRVLLTVDGGSGILMRLFARAYPPRASIAIPAIATLVGTELHAQALLSGPAPYVLTNAQDIVIGTCACR